MRTGLAIPDSLSSITPLSLNRVDAVHNDYTKLLGQFPELTRPTTKGETIKHGFTHKIVTKGHPVFARPRRLLFARLAEYDIIIGPEKCQFGTIELSFLGHHVCSEAISPLPSAVDAIVNFAKPEKQRALRKYLGMVNYYHRFIPQCAAKLTPLNNLLTAANDGHTRLSPKSNFDLKWTLSRPSRRTCQFRELT